MTLRLQTSQVSLARISHWRKMTYLYLAFERGADDISSMVGALVPLMGVRRGCPVHVRG